MNWWNMIKSERNRLNQYERPHYDTIMEIMDLLEEGELRTTLIDAISKWTKGYREPVVYSGHNAG